MMQLTFIIRSALINRKGYLSLEYMGRSKVYFNELD